ncbi:type II secretion system protein [Pseudocolwellia agarivorans]|uniref:type II secretion system protein n=1 Tax=Pseudocolwellia agarivorans TaxID=1911682 RepID=UPI000985870E|nr:prepilin-type N-terminal cleavage/methylation domain-containing protein [Pseudocolwellia agarivorans]
MKKINKSSLNTQKGFTLIELVVVIVILGILAATAAPKFIDLTSDAKKATMKGLRGAVESATSMVHAKALVSNTIAESSSKLTVNGSDINVFAGWPTNEAATWTAIASISSDSFLSVVSSTSANGSSEIVWYPFQETALADVAAAKTAACYVSYTESLKSAIRPIITIVDTGC